MGWRKRAAGMIGAAALAGCQPGLSEAEMDRMIGPPRVEELARVTSPDSLVDAVVLRVNVHATTPFAYQVHLVPRGAPVSGDAGLEFAADHVEDLAVAWTGPVLLEIRYAQARIFRFSNFWQSREVRDFRHIVELRLRPATASSLPRPEWPEDPP